MKWSAVARESEDDGGARSMTRWWWNENKKENGGDDSAAAHVRSHPPAFPAGSERRNPSSIKGSSSPCPIGISEIAGHHVSGH
jgi:hypothetical protein